MASTNGSVWAGDVLGGALFGALLGGGSVAILKAMRQRTASAQGVVSRSTHLASDVQLAELISRFEPLAVHSPQCQAWFDELLRSADELVGCHTRPADGGTTRHLGFHANRLSNGAVSAARRLCFAAFEKHADDTGTDMARELPTLEEMLGNHVRNIMLT